MKRPGLFLFLLLLMANRTFGQPAAPPNAQSLFEKNCAGCHADRAALGKMTPEAVYAALTSGSMRQQASTLAETGRRSIAEYLTGAKLNLALFADARKMPNQCPGDARSAGVSNAAAWNGWGADTSNTRFQTEKAAGLKAAQIPQLKLKWSFGFPGATSVWGQPAVAGGSVFLGVDTGFVYAIDASTGCVHWSFEAEAGVRTAITVDRGTAWFGDGKANVYAVNATTGQQIWKVRIEDHTAARLTGAPKLFEGRLYVPVSSSEEGAGGNPRYPCCTFRGSVVALDAASGRQLWKTYTIADAPQPTVKTAAGVQHWGPAGAAVWSSPTIDAKRRALYVGTGDAYTEPAAKNTDAVVAMDLDSGRILWSAQDTENDTWLAGCNANAPTGNCPETLGPDHDFASPPILKTLPNGHRILIVGQKSGNVWAHDPDRNGAVVWKTALTANTTEFGGKIIWGGAADDQNAYFGLGAGGIAAVQIKQGERKWFTPLQPTGEMAKHPGQDGPLTAISGVVFSGGWDGVLRALSTIDGRVVWEYNTAREFEAANGVVARGGSMGAAGPVVAGGMLFVNSGYVGVKNGMPGNVLLAFSAQ
jgi:polyvinyl alcohol dehydrogenase (cytochrome)